MRARGLTLIEVVASLVLLAVTVTALLASHARSMEQLTENRRHHLASELARELILTWQLDPEGSRDLMAGTFDDHKELRWTKRRAPRPVTARSALDEITLTIYRRDDKGNEEPVASYTWIERRDEG